MSIETAPLQTVHFRISPLIRYTLIGLLAALVLPLPVLAVRQQAPVSLPMLLVGIAGAFLVLAAALAQRVRVDTEGVAVDYPVWVPSFFGKRWRVGWSEVVAIDSRPTSQGGRVHYLVDHRGNRYLLPMRIAGFARFLRLFEERTGIATATVKPLAQPWMYLALLVCVVLMLACDLLIVAASVQTARIQ